MPAVALQNGTHRVSRILHASDVYFQVCSLLNLRTVGIGVRNVARHARWAAVLVRWTFKRFPVHPEHTGLIGGEGPLAALARIKRISSDEVTVSAPIRKQPLVGKDISGLAPAREYRINEVRRAFPGIAGRRRSEVLERRRIMSIFFGVGQGSRVQ